MDQQLSQAGEEALKAVKALSQAEQLQVAGLVAVDLAARINDAASTASPEKRATASLNIDEAVKTARHGFKQVTAPDGTAAIEVKITGKDAPCLLSEGARGKFYRDLADYGKNKLKGATLLSHGDFKAVVESLHSAIKDQKVVEGVLQTEDKALKQAYQMVTQGVRLNGGFSWAVFDVDGGGAVVGRRFIDRDDSWVGLNGRIHCAAFVSPPAESK